MPHNSFKKQHEAAALAARLPELMLEADRVATSVMQGVHGRRRSGQGEVFWQFKPYERGDNVRAIDWRQSAKTDQHYIRQNEWEAAQSVYLWRDGSGSMDFQSSGLYESKRDRANLILLSLANLLIAGGEYVSLLGSGQRAGRSKAHLEQVAMFLCDDGFKPDFTPEFGDVSRHSHVILISDFLSPIDEIAAKLQTMSGRGVQGHLVQVLDIAEEQLPYAGRVEFLGMEGESPETLQRVDAVRDVYHQRLIAHRGALSDLARHMGWGFSYHRSDQSAHAALLNLYMDLTREKVV